MQGSTTCSSSMQKVAEWLQQLWYGNSRLAWLLWPLTLLYRLLTLIDYRRHPPSWRCPVPVIVVGNLTVGGTGKTPVCLALARHYSRAGRRVVLLSRGYGGRPADSPRLATAGADPAEVGDEALLLAEASGCPVVVDRQRARAARHAVEQLGADLLISDDGLQHRPLWRDVELVVIDGRRGFGNGLLLPAGPLREPVARLGSVDALLIHGDLQVALPATQVPRFSLALHPVSLVHVRNGQRRPLVDALAQQGSAPCHAVAAIGDPERFFATLRRLGFAIIPHAFADHHAYGPDELAFAAGQCLLMTAKDAVKCRQFAGDDWWYLEVDMTLPAGLLALLDSVLRNPHA